MGIDADLAANGIPYPVARELIAAMNGTPTTALRLQALGVQGRLAVELAAQVNGGTKNANALMALGVPFGLANAIAGSGSVVPLTAIRATGAGFGLLSEQGPSTGIAQTSRIVTPPFLEEFEMYRLVYPVFRVRDTIVTATVDNGAGAAGNTLTVTAVSRGGIYVGTIIANAGLAANVRIVSQVSGNLGGTGVYTISGAAVLIASGTFTSDFADELHQGAGAVCTYDVGVADSYTPGYTGLPARRPVTFDTGSATKVYNYASWDKSVGYFKSDWMTRPGGRSKAPMEVWTRATLPANGAGIPVNKNAQNVFVDRGWGAALVTSGTAPDPVTATSITTVATTSNGLTGVIAPIAIEIMTAGASPTVIAFGDSRHASTGLGVNEPAGYGDQMGNALALMQGTERGLYELAKCHSLMLAKPSDRVQFQTRSPGAWGLRLGLAAAIGDNGVGNKIVISAGGQNDQGTSTPVTDYSANMVCPLGTIINSSGRVYITTVGGVGDATAPTGTSTGTDIDFGTARIRYIGTGATTTERLALGMAGKALLNNRVIRAAISGVRIIQEALGPYTTAPGDNWMTAAGQQDGFGTAAGIAYQALLAGGAQTTGADAVVSMMPFQGGSRTTNGGANDGTRTWATTAAGNVPYYLTPDGIHAGNFGAEIGKQAWTRLAVTGSAT